ncbi:MAG: hypothetical protein IT158_16795 [Bryobacterales bacterium]|nr:hypothetical protein [Bryobacterales bacterium]
MSNCCLRLCALALLSTGVLGAGPVEFGMAELRKALEARGLPEKRFRVVTEVTTDPPESYTIRPGRIGGGDLRGLMYGLLAAAEQIGTTGRLVSAQGAPRTPVRGIRHFLHNADLEKDWYYSRDYWARYLAMLARARFNRFNLVFAHQTNYLAPPYPFWIALPEFPDIRVPGLAAAERDRNLEMLQYISRTASEYGIDFTLGVWEHNIQPGMQPTVEGLTAENIGPYSYAALKKILELCPAIRSVQMRTNSESGIPGPQQVPFYRDYVFRAIREAGRRVVLDLRGWIMAGGMAEAAMGAGVPLRVSSKYWAEDLGRPYPPAETFPNYSYLNLLQKPRPYDFLFEVWGLGSHRLLLWGDPGYVRRAVPTFTLSGASGFEIDPPLAQKGFGNRPGRWGVFTESNRDRVFWKYEFERYWLFYQLWGRLSYDPATPDGVFLAELRDRFGPAAQDVFDAYRNSSRVLNEIVAVHLADPNMYIWPEINPGGLIDAYKQAPPSDWRYVASIGEAVGNRLENRASARQTPEQTAARLDQMAAATEEALERARSKMPGGPAEWRSSEADFTVLALLARYHARKQTAAERLEYFDRTGDGAALATARRELTAAVAVWEKLAAFTGGLYPAGMAFGPDDIGHWKDKLPYVRHDLELVREREEVFERFGRFDVGFDFGAPPAPSKGASWRQHPYILGNHVAPRFRHAGADEASGWTGPGKRELVSIPLTPYLEVRAVSRNPGQLPREVLLRDFVRGQGRQYFRARTGPGEFTAMLVDPNGKVTEMRLKAEGDHVTVPFPEGPWEVSALLLKGPGAAAPLPAPRTPRMLPRPAILHTPPAALTPGKPLELSLKISPAASVSAVRLHYRPVNQLARFEMLEAVPPRLTFTIPAEAISSHWDLMYYFEILNSEGGGWFEPDPDQRTPYYVLK